MANDCNVYYKDFYCPTVGLTNYTEQLKEYIDAKFDDMPSDAEMKVMEENITNAMSNVETNLANSLTNVEGNLAASITNSESNIAKQVDNASNKTICCLKETLCNMNESIISNVTEAIETSADNVIEKVQENATKDKEEIINKIEETSESGNTAILEAIEAAKDAVTGTTLELLGNVESNLSNAITTSADNVVKAVSADITTSADNVVKQVYENTEREKGEIISAVISKTDEVSNEVEQKAKENKELIDKAREELLAALENSNNIMEAGFSDLNTNLKSTSDEAVKAINRRANKNKREIINAISDITPEPYTVYGGSVYNIVHPNVTSMTEADVKNLVKIENTEGTDTVFSIRVKDVAVAGMNDDATGEVYNQAKATNELNIVFAYPSKFTDVEVRDSIDMNITNDFAKNEITIDGEAYTVIMNPTKIINLYDPQWESPMDYTLNYTLDVQ